MVTGLITSLIFFLIIGIGIDDMFIITETWDKNKVEVGEIIPLTAKSTMKVCHCFHAGDIMKYLIEITL